MSVMKMLVRILMKPEIDVVRMNSMITMLLYDERDDDE